MGPALAYVPARLLLAGPIEEWLAEESEPASWSLGLPAGERTQLLWAVDDVVRARVERYELNHPPGSAELEDFIADFGKVRNAYATGDEFGLRLAAQGLAGLCPSVLRLLNPEGRVGSRREAFQVALDFPTAPDGYREDMLVCLGLSGRATTPQEVYGAAHRLVRGVVALLRPYADRLAPHLQPYLPQYLADGTLEQYLK